MTNIKTLSIILYKDHTVKSFLLSKYRVYLRMNIAYRVNSTEFPSDLDIFPGTQCPSEVADFG